MRSAVFAFLSRLSLAYFDELTHEQVALIDQLLAHKEQELLQV